MHVTCKFLYSRSKERKKRVGKEGEGESSERSDRGRRKEGKKLLREKGGKERCDYHPKGCIQTVRTACFPIPPSLAL